MAQTQKIEIKQAMASDKNICDQNDNDPFLYPPRFLGVTSIPY